MEMINITNLQGKIYLFVLYLMNDPYVNDENSYNDNHSEHESHSEDNDSYYNPEHIFFDDFDEETNGDDLFEGKGLSDNEYYFEDLDNDVDVMKTKIKVGSSLSLICQRKWQIINGKVNLLTRKWLSSKLQTSVRENPKLKLNDIREKAQMKWNTRITKVKAFTTRNRVKNMVDGLFKKQYRRIYDYTHELLRSNMGSTIKMKVESRQVDGDAME
ncbi:hypothetical protein CR513_14827, partial [Mucuna pruriens]